MRATRSLAMIAVLAAVSCFPGSALAYPTSYDFRFGNVTGNSSVTAGTGAQYSFELIDLGAKLVGFRFFNSGGLASSITEIDIQAGPTSKGMLKGLSAIVESGRDVDFTSGSKTRLISGGSQTPDLLVNSKLSATSRRQNARNGVDAGGEWVTLVYKLERGATFADVQAAVDRAYNNPGTIWSQDGTAASRSAPQGIRVGIRVQGYSNGGSESFIARAGLMVPEPPSFAVAALGAVGMLLHGSLRRRCPRS